MELPQYEDPMIRYALKVMLMGVGFIYSLNAFESLFR